MYSDLNYGSVSIGLPGRVLSSTEEAAKDPYISKIGGKPVWHDASTVPSSPLRCRHCNRTERMLLVCQIYAPTDRPRSIYIFCCNQRQCSLTSRGWIILRNQAKEPDAAKHSSPPLALLPLAAAATATTSKPPPSSSSMWSFLEEENPSVPEVQLDDLEKMLLARDEALRGSSSASAKNAAAAEGTGAGDKAISERSIETQNTRQSTYSAASAIAVPDPIVSQEWSPCFRIVDTTDVWQGKAVSASTLSNPRKKPQPEALCGIDQFDDTDEREEDDEEEGDRFNLNVATDGHIQQMLAGYLQDDPDEELLKIMDSVKHNAGDAGAGGVRGGGSSKGVGSNRKVFRSRDNEDDDTGWVRKLTRNTMRSKTELYFQRRTAGEPRQVLRYAYGGDPLWCTHPPPHDSAHVDPCRCGADRCFELQLMPALLAQQMTAAASSSSSTADSLGVITENGCLLVREQNVSPAAQEPPRACGEDAGGETASAGSLIEAGFPLAGADVDDGGEEDEVITRYAQPSDSQIADLLKRLGDELDFGVLTVWCCPESCATGVEEIAVVQHPADIS